MQKQGMMGPAPIEGQPVAENPYDNILAQQAFATGYGQPIMFQMGNPQDTVYKSSNACDWNNMYPSIGDERGDNISQQP